MKEERVTPGNASMTANASTATPAFLDDRGRASTATIILMVHHGLRRDLRRLDALLGAFTDGDRAWAARLSEAWTELTAVLHQHHQGEETRLFPELRRSHAALGPVLDALGADHAALQSRIERGGATFSALGAPHAKGAASIALAGLAELLGPHLASEEEHLLSQMRGMPLAAPPSVSEAEVALIARGVSWASDGVPPEVVELTLGAYPAAVRERLPVAREEYAARCARIWGDVAR